MYDLTLAPGLGRHLVAAARPVEAHLFLLSALRPVRSATVARARRIPAFAHTAAFAVAR